jgi:TfoX/Sxy family transcriptional regulator of competence genes
MAFDEGLAERIRKRLAGNKGLTEKKMFGGFAFLLNGNMCCGVHRRELIVRLDPAQTAAALAEPHTRIFDLSGRPMKGWILVEPAGLADDPALAKWLRLGTKFAASLPKKRKISTQRRKGAKKP